MQEFANFEASVDFDRKIRHGENQTLSIPLRCCLAKRWHENLLRHHAFVFIKSKQVMHEQAQQRRPKDRGGYAAADIGG